MLDYANDHAIPVWTVIKLLDFLKAKDEAVFTNLKWSDNNLSFKIQSSLTHTNGITCMIPYQYRSKKVGKISINGTTRSYTVRPIKGFEYALVTVKPGTTYNMEVQYIN